MKKELFQFQYTNPDFVGMRCFLGNGYQSAEISNNLGQGAGICNYLQSPFPIMRLAGVYSYTSTIPAPEKRNQVQMDTIFRLLNTFGILPLDLDNPSHPKGDDLNEFLPTEFTQVFDMKQAVVKTNSKIEQLMVETEVFLSQSHPNFGALKVNVSKSNGDHFGFCHLTRKDPYTCYEKVALKEIGHGKSLWEVEFPEDGFDVQKKGLYHIAQITGIEVFDEHGNQLEFSYDRSEEDTDSVDFNEVSVWTTTVKCSPPKISTDQKYRWTVILYFGVYKQSDCETPRYANAYSGVDQGQRAIQGLEEVMGLGYGGLFQAHKDAWEKDIWQNLIEVPDADENIQKMLISSFYVMGCTYLEGLAYGNGPNGINGHWWAGRTFWDHDLWVNMGLILWAPAMARNFNLFRFNTMDGARENRKRDVERFRSLGILDKYGLNITEGLKYPWESTTSGMERTPNGGRPNIQEHISCDVIHGMWLQYLVTQDRQFLEQVALPVAYESALYLGQRVRKEADGKWHFRYVLCADEFADQKDDNAFTNLYLEKCMKIVVDWCQLLGKDYPKHWEEISGNMKYHFDAVNMRILEHETYKNEVIKQADTDLITWPLEHDVVYGQDGETIRRNNMLFYFDRLPENHIMMGACIFSIVALELGMQEKGWEYFADQFPHFHPELSYIPSENPKNDCWPFITGIGGFLSNLIYGFGGIRMRPDGLLFCPRLDPKLPRLIIPHIYFQGMDLRYEVVEGGHTFILTNYTEPKKFTIYMRNQRIYIPETTPEIILKPVKHRTEQYYTVLLPKNQAVTFHKQ